MKIKLKRLANHVPGATFVHGKYTWKTGEVRDVPDEIGHKLLGDYPGFFEAAKEAPKEPVKKVQPKAENKQAESYRNK